MKFLNLTIDKGHKKIYLKIAEAIRTAIKNGLVAPSDKLPSARTLAEQLGVNRHTAMAAYNELVAQGWVDSQQRRGYQVAKSLPVISSLTAQKVQQQPDIPHNWRVIKADASQVERPASQYKFNFAGGNPDIELFPFNEFRSFMNDALTRPALTELNYGNNAGFPDFIQEVGRYLRRARSITNKELIVVNGTQEALYIIAQILLTQGDKVAVESLGYRPAWQALKNTGAELIGIKQTEHGIDVDELERQFKKHTIRLLYLTPLHQYPTTTTLSVAKRVEIYRLAKQYNVPIIEDDYDHEFHYSSQPLAPIAANDPAGLVIYLSSFSKILFPGIRLGVIAADKKLIPHIINYRTLINHKANVLLQDAIARWMRDGGFERHLRKATRVYQKRRKCMVDMLNAFKEEGLDINFNCPQGGMALWVDVGKNAKKIEDLAREKGIFLLTERSFCLESKDCQDRFVRLGFAGQNEDMIQQGLLALKPLLNKLNHER